MRTLLAFAAAVEGATGLALMLHPPIVTMLLLGDGVSDAGMALGRVAGIALLSLALACWPRGDGIAGKTPSLRALLTYNLLVTLYLLRLGVFVERVGRLLWPAILLHALLTLLLARAWFTKTSGAAASNRKA
jgi:hypothetical protein